ncbi:hypothetical protein C5L39_06790 [Corynebacterium alimapuense]|uniref:5,10-methylene-tetrahydrofolate dehydrogenase n=1 Tax=Corynebacterium alimapuense TaxID=1576874 RepID=A0A3M8K8Z4_9CORY|nr:hypothetical protein C5L39_06790 [Corynebacterium alimapuense]
MEVIGILADEGKPLEEVQKIASQLLEDIQHETEEDGTRSTKGKYPDIGEIEIRAETVPMSPDGDVLISHYAGRILEDRGWDRLIYITDLPLTAWEHPVVSQRAVEDNAILISLPALGAFQATRRLRKELISLIEDSEPKLGVFRKGSDPVEKEDSAEAPDVRTRILEHPGRSLQMVAGMVRGNQPGHLIPVLSSSLAAIAATGGFGIFYGSIWTMAEGLSNLRLLLISLLSVVALTSWLIVHNRLWQRRGTQETRWRERVDNLATVGTIGLTVLMIYLLALLVMFVAAGVVIPASYLETELGRDIGLPTYLAIAWLSASLGTMAGSLGSNFDRDVEIRSATYNLREYERRMRQGRYTDERWLPKG